ncbi:MAG: pentapeptide repeat-containing protein [Acidobacteria bacterium]|nr:pentapeptide repeat-containing protein [Acidobacteriota bacterium]
MDFSRLKKDVARKLFRLGILYRIALQKFLSLLEVAVIPLLLIVSLALVGFVLWESRQWYAAAGKIPELSQHIQAKNEIMRTLAQVLGGAFILTGLYFTAKNVFVSRRAQITDRFADALEKLSDTGNMLKRIGGIHALESIARDSPDDHWRIMEIFTEFVRINTTDEAYVESQGGIAPEKRRPRADIQQILNAIGRRQRTYGMGERRRLDLTGANLDGADLQGANLEGGAFRGASLRGAVLLGAHLRGANFTAANLEGANLNLSDLKKTIFHRARLARAQLRNACLRETSFSMSDLQHASFEGTELLRVNFPNAVLEGASFEESRLWGCTFAGARLNQAILKKAEVRASEGLTNPQVASAVTDEHTILELPPGETVGQENPA